MSDLIDAGMPDVGAVIIIRDQLVRWLCSHALPLWDRHGVDRAGGGYFESIEMLGADEISVTGEVRRGRVVARQIYVFDVGHKLGWRSQWPNPVDHGCEYLMSRLHRGNGIFNTSVRADALQPADAFSLYEHAFYLFALARLESPTERSIRCTALLCLSQLKDRWHRSNGGFDEASPSTLPLKSNPHMHLLEAAMAWMEVSEEAARQPWLELAEEIVGLCLSRFIDVETGAVREYFDHDWRPYHGDAGRIVEPGHQFEWAWLLLRWASVRANGAAGRACVSAALRLMEVGERWGVDQARGVAINELWDDLGAKDSDAKFWPQTERLKAWCARLDASRALGEAGLAVRKIGEAGRGLLRYLREPAGLWHEVWSADGSFVSGPSKASSFYHVVCAIEVLRQTVATHPVMRAMATRASLASGLSPVLGPA